MAVRGPPRPFSAPSFVTKTKFAAILALINVHTPRQIRFISTRVIDVYQTVI
jgi:hypothetical protein